MLIIRTDVLWMDYWCPEIATSVLRRDRLGCQAAPEANIVVCGAHAVSCSTKTHFLWMSRWEMNGKPYAKLLILTLLSVFLPIICAILIFRCQSVFYSKELYPLHLDSQAVLLKHMHFSKPLWNTSFLVIPVSRRLGRNHHTITQLLNYHIITEHTLCFRLLICGVDILITTEDTQISIKRFKF